MPGRDTLVMWVNEAVEALGGKAKIADVAKNIWENHRSEIEASGKLLYTWQYDMRWAAMVLRKKGVFSSVEDAPRGVWAIASYYR